MSSLTGALLLVAGLVVVATAAFVVLARRSDVRGAGALSAGTVRRHQYARARARSSRVTDAATATDAGAPDRRDVDRERWSEHAPAMWEPSDIEALGATRRQFLNRSIVSLTGVALGTSGAASMIAFLWPTGTGDFGGRVVVGSMDDVLAGIASGHGFLYVSRARTWITAYPSSSLPAAGAEYDPVLLPGMRAGLVASYQRCPHLGCRVPECLSSQWFECPCHGSRFSRVGEYRAGPAPRGLDQFPIDVLPTTEVAIDTGHLVLGLPVGTDVTGQSAEGPTCIGDFDH